MILVLLTLVLFICGTLLVNYLNRNTKDKSAVPESFSDKITPKLADFQWQTLEPEVYRPMKDGIYKMTMGIKNLDYDEYILFDKNYVERTNLRVKIVEELPDETVLFNPIAQDAVREYYDYVMNFYLQRFPMIFEVRDGEIYNSARDESLPLSSKGKDLELLLQILARHMEDDFLILLKDEPEGEFILRAGTTVFPNGFSPLYNLNKQLSLIHQPVPQYNTKLKLAMNKFFDRVKPFQFVYRVNWGIQTHTNLLALTGTHGRPQEHAGSQELDLSTLDFNKIFLRSERQVLTKLPNSGAAVLSLKTYVTPLTKIRDESCAETLIGAIEKLPLDIALYKNRPKWGKLVLQYLRGETNGVTDERYDYTFTT